MNAARLQELIYGKNITWRDLDETEKEALHNSLNGQGGEVLLRLLAGRWRRNALAMHARLGNSMWSNGKLAGSAQECVDTIQKMCEWKTAYAKRKDRDDTRQD
jgi:hypothetical protein